jgi:hypothetical protein
MANPQNPTMNAVPSLDEYDKHSLNEMRWGSIERLAICFERSSRRWERIVYPSLFAFIVLAMYGFYLIYSLTNDMRNMSNAMDPEMGHHMARLVDSMDRLSVNLDAMTNSVATMDVNLQIMTENMSSITSKMDNISSNMDTLRPMLTNMTDMSGAMGRMERDMGSMNNNIARPMSFFNSFMPF